MKRVFSYAVAVSVGIWLAELGRYLSQHAPPPRTAPPLSDEARERMRNSKPTTTYQARPVHLRGGAIIEGRLHR